jgi:t-SNARE complex subunit (syntaxin)
MLMVLIYWVKANTCRSILVTSKESGIEINAKRIRNLKSHEQNALKYYSIIIIIIIIIIYILKVSNC